MNAIGFVPTFVATFGSKAAQIANLLIMKEVRGLGLEPRTN